MEHRRQGVSEDKKFLPLIGGAASTGVWYFCLGRRGVREIFSISAIIVVLLAEQFRSTEYGTI
jgi:hypothetical protein